ncbi:MAG: cbb3-type cytochrome oxidase assembly protein CcoS [Myxococcota bacterium]
MLYLALPIALLLAGAAIAAFVRSVREGQLDDLDSPPQRMLHDD